MMAAHVSVWLLAAALGQAPAQGTAGWMKAVPSEADVVVRCRGIASAAEDFKAMLKVASPNAAASFAPMIDQFVDQWRKQGGVNLVDAPVVGLLRVEEAGPDGLPPFAILVMKDDYESVLKAVANRQVITTKAEDGGYDSFPSPAGAGAWYAFHGEGFTAFGPDRTLIAKVAKPDGGSPVADPSPALATPFRGGDLGIFVNAERLVGRYDQRIDQNRQALMAALDQAAKAAPNGASMGAVKDMYGRAFDALKTTRRLAFNLDFAASGVRIAGRLEAKPAADAKAAEAVGTVSADLAKLDPGAAFYMYMNMPADVIQSWQNLSLRMLSPAGKPTPELAKAMERFKAVGKVETIGSAAMADGMRTFNVSTAKDPKALVEASEAMLQAMKDTNSPYNVYKDVKVERDAKKHGGMSFTRVTAEFDMDKIAKLGQGGGNADQIKAILGGDSMSYWIGADGQRVIQVTAPTWEEAEARLDRFDKGESTVGALAGFQQVRSELADRASLLMIVSGQGLARMLAAQMAATMKRPELKDPAGLPAEPAFFGGSLTPAGPGGYDFRISLPSAMGPIVEKAMSVGIESKPVPPRLDAKPQLPR